MCARWRQRLDGEHRLLMRDRMSRRGLPHVLIRRRSFFFVFFSNSISKEEMLISEHLRVDENMRCWLRFLMLCITQVSALGSSLGG